MGHVIDGYYRDGTDLSECSLSDGGVGSALAHHEGRRKGGRARPGERGPLSCRECPLKFENACSLEDHGKATGHHIFACPVPGCDRTYPRRDTWSRHKKTHEAIFTCEVCPQGYYKRTFKRKDHLTAHMRNRHAKLDTSILSQRPAKQHQNLLTTLQDAGLSDNAAHQDGAVQDIVEGLKRDIGSQTVIMRQLEERLDLARNVTEQLERTLATIAVDSP